MADHLAFDGDHFPSFDLNFGNAVLLNQIVQQHLGEAVISAQVGAPLQRAGDQLGAEAPARFGQAIQLQLGGPLQLAFRQCADYALGKHPLLGLLHGQLPLLQLLGGLRQ